MSYSVLMMTTCRWRRQLSSAPAVDGALDVLFDLLSGAFDQVVVDLPRWRLAEHLARLDRLLLVTEPTLAGLRDALRLKEAVDARTQSELPVEIILNKGGAAKNGELAVADAIKAGLPKPAYVLPDETKAQAQAMALGKPMVHLAPRAKAARVFAAMARDLALGDDEAMGGKSLFGMILGGRK